MVKGHQWHEERGINNIPSPLGLFCPYSGQHKDSFCKGGHLVLPTFLNCRDKVTLVLQAIQGSANLNKESLSRPLLSPPTAVPAEDLPLVFTFGSTKRCKVHSSPSSPSHKTSITRADTELISLHTAAAVEVCFVQSPCGPCPASSSLCHHDPHENSHFTVDYFSSCVQSLSEPSLHFRLTWNARLDMFWSILAPWGI